MIRKIDYFCGAFLSFLVSNNITTPTLFEAGDKSKIVKFTTDKFDYKVYIKYAANSSDDDKNGVKRWNINFTENEMNIIRDFAENGRKLFFVLVCTNHDLNETEIAVLDFDKGLKCLGDDNINKTHRITVVHKKGSRYLSCYGTAKDEKDGIPIFKDFKRYFLDEIKDYV